MQQHYIEFYSPGTFICETDLIACASWDIDEAQKIASSIMQRHGARPFGFRFITRERNEEELDAKRVAQSPLYYLGGQILTLEDIEARNDLRDRLLLANMRNMGIKAVVENRNSYLFTGALAEGDVVLDFTMPQMPEARGDA